MTRRPAFSASAPDDCEVAHMTLMVSLSNHARLDRASFDKLRMNTASSG